MKNKSFFEKIFSSVAGSKAVEHVDVDVAVDADQDAVVDGVALATDAPVQVAASQDVQDYVQSIAVLESAVNHAAQHAAELSNQNAELLLQINSLRAVNKQLIIDRRMAQLSAEVGDVRAPALMEALAEVADEQFNSILAALKGSMAAEAASTMFNEKGLSSVVDEPIGVDTETPEMKALKAKHKAKEE